MTSSHLKRFSVIALACDFPLIAAGAVSSRMDRQLARSGVYAVRAGRFSAKGAWVWWLNDLECFVIH